MARYMCKKKYYEQGAWFEVKCVKDVIEMKEGRGEDASFERGLLKSWEKCPEYKKYIK